LKGIIRQVQHIHMQLATNKKAIPSIILPEKRGDITVSDVLDAKPGVERDEMIRRWCVSVWGAYKDVHDTIIKYFSENII
jgi:hypothetical protein